MTMAVVKICINIIKINNDYADHEHDDDNKYL